MTSTGEDADDERPSMPVDMPTFILQNLKKREGTWRPYGNYRIFCGGCIVIGPVRSWWWLLEIFSLILTITFIIEYEKYNLGVWIAGLVLYLIVFLSSWMTLMRDPGILKKPLFSEAIQNAKEAAARVPYGSFGGAYLDKYSSGGEPIRHSYCFRCHIWRPPRAGHCTVCGVCHLNWDHHCPVYGGCVAKNNLASFRVMTVSITIHITYLLVVSCYVGVYWYQDGKTDSFLKASFVLDEIIIGIILSIVLGPVLTQLPCEKEFRDLPPDNKLRNESMLQVLIENAHRHRMLTQGNGYGSYMRPQIPSTSYEESASN